MQYRGFVPGLPTVELPTCWRAVDDTHHYLKPPTERPLHVIPPAALASEHLGGCAAVTFQVQPDGKAANIHIIREIPTGMGITAAVTETLRQAAFTPPASSADVFYFGPIIIPPGVNAILRLPPAPAQSGVSQ